MIAGLVAFTPNALDEHLSATASFAALFKLVNSDPNVEVNQDHYLFVNQFTVVLPNNHIKPVMDLLVTLSWP